ncbi:MAG: SusC/RagA family TonB-linked outer membrane protein [Arachidicoccus sp.]|nr:SusC/RagA family TonB-linked outer membrane protein [Arachidicoccus sp.]
MVYRDNEVKSIKDVSARIEADNVSEALNILFRDLPFTYSVVEKTVVIRRKALTRKEALTDIAPVDAVKEQPQESIRGRVVDSLGNPLPGATIKVRGTDITAIADRDGRFSIETADAHPVLEISYIGYQTATIDGNSNTRVVLHEKYSELDETIIASTGYQQIPKERATGSFIILDSSIINREVSTDILSRLNGMVSGLKYNSDAVNPNYMASVNPLLRQTGLEIRGPSTFNISVNANPLIVVDNFPYDGDMSNINPNDVESITVLKDAAAASIWGARAGNGVIVITTKKGRKKQPLNISLNTNVTVTNKPNLYYDRNYLKSSDYIEVEKYLFNQGFFDSDLSNDVDYPVISPAAEIMTQERNGAITADAAASQLAALSGNDVRKDWDKYFYQKAVKQQYYLGIKGGSEKMANNFSIGFDKNLDNLVRNGLERITLNSFNTYTPVKNLEISAGITYTQSKIYNNNQQAYMAIGIGSSNYGNLYPYARFADDAGNPVAISMDLRSSFVAAAPSLGLEDWSYKPLDELRLADNTIKNRDILLKAGIKYRIVDFVSAEVLYQNEWQNIQSNNFRDAASYYVRNLVNEFSIINQDGSIDYQFPNSGGILAMAQYNWYTNNARGQLNFDRIIQGRHHINAIMGTEIKELKTKGYSNSYYGYDKEFGTSDNKLDYTTYLSTYPSVAATISTPNSSITGVTNRFVSFYANASYDYENRYQITLSGRRDGANLFGVKTNDKITPLWSAGIGWNLSKESFYHLDWLPYLKLRGTYGINGNVYYGTAYTTGRYSTSGVTGLTYITNLTAPNPELHWEKIKVANAGVDFATANNIFSGSIEFYIKNAADLVEPSALPPSSGFSSYTSNAANMKTTGADINLTSHNINSILKWNTTLLLSNQNNKITKYDVSVSSGSVQGDYMANGYPLNSIFSYRWAGLDPQTGDPQGYLNGAVSKDYTGIINNYQADSLVYNGSAQPRFFGSLRNDFYYKGFSLSFNILFKFSYYFRRSSIGLSYTDLINLYPNEDYEKRWQKTGDEHFTNIPSLVYPSDINRTLFYRFSEILVNKGDHIRLQDIRLGYDFKQAFNKLPLYSLQLYAYAANLGILWRANHYGLDPDLSNSYISHSIPTPFSLSLGVQASF